MNDLDLAWAAGFIDGEGCIGVYAGKRRYFRLALDVAQVGPEPLYELQRLFGGSVRERTLAPTNHRRAHVWTICASGAARALSMVRPYLRQKGDQADLAIQFQSRIAGRGFSRVSDQEQEIRANLAAEVRALKKVA